MPQPPTQRRSGLPLPAPKYPLDTKDRQILKLLQDDGRMTNAELARRINLSAPSTLQRLRKLEESGVIKGYSAELDRDNMGYGLLVIALVSLSLHQEKAIETFRETVTKMEEVQEVLHISGDHDFMLKIIVPDMHSYRDLIYDTLSQIPGVGRIHSCFVLGLDKETRELPL
ncbi:MAG: Lrp/AsnC family transcriptional regulator [Fimbriimonadaceae bacterium]|nr:Lrp/AsnC family transcriptional regulator [Fimbriimonadaceae bacterium]